MPNSPETNMLDLGVWAALQSLVEFLHKEKVMQPDHLNTTIFQAFEKISSEILSKVHERWKLVLKLIVAGKGTNDLVEKHRGLKSKLLDLPTLPDDSDGLDEVSDHAAASENEPAA